jgi:hypothetical protein
MQASAITLIVTQLINEDGLARQCGGQSMNAAD